MKDQKNKMVTMNIDSENGIKLIILGDGNIEKSVSVSNDGGKFLDSLGADVIFHFDKNNKLISVELMGL